MLVVLPSESVVKLVVEARRFAANPFCEIVVVNQVVCVICFRTSGLDHPRQSSERIARPLPGMMSLIGRYNSVARI